MFHNKSCGHKLDILYCTCIKGTYGVCANILEWNEEKNKTNIVEIYLT